MSDAPVIPIKPYLLRAWHQWCTDNGKTPYIAVFVDQYVDVPREFVKDEAIVLNVGFVATDGLNIDNDYINFKGRFSGQVRELWVPVSHVTAIFARESQEGMEFPRPTSQELAALAAASGGAGAELGANKPVEPKLTAKKLTTNPSVSAESSSSKPAGGLRIVK